MPQDHPPFTEDELYSVYSLFRPEAQARKRARDMVDVFVAMTNSPRTPSVPNQGGVVFTPLPSVSFVGEEEILMVDDLLALLSLQSESVARRVDHFRQGVWFEANGTDEAAWRTRRSEWAEWLRDRGGG